MGIMQEQPSKNGAPNDIPEGNGDLVPDKPLLHSNIGAEQDSSRNEKHIHNGVLKRQCEEHRDRQPDGRDLAGRRGGA